MGVGVGGNSASSMRHLAMPGHIVGRCNWKTLVSRGQGCCWTSYDAQDSHLKTMIVPQCHIAPRLRNLALTHWKPPQSSVLGILSYHVLFVDGHTEAQSGLKTGPYRPETPIQSACPPPEPALFTVPLTWPPTQPVFASPLQQLFTESCSVPSL